MLMTGRYKGVCCKWSVHSWSCPTAATQSPHGSPALQVLLGPAAVPVIELQQSSRRVYAHKHMHVG
jgi:hypothetical protein